MTALKNGYNTAQLENSFMANRTYSGEKPTELSTNSLPLSYFDIIDETPEFSEAAILLEDETIEYCYIKLATDGSQYFGFNCSLPGSPEYNEILARHKLAKPLEANTFEKYPSGKTILSKGGKVLEINLPIPVQNNV
jgi:hypothetical protein